LKEKSPRQRKEFDRKESNCLLKVHILPSTTFQGHDMQKIADETVMISVYIPKETREKLDRIAARQKPGKESKISDVARTMLLFGLDVYEDFERIGLVRVVEVFTKAKTVFGEIELPETAPILDK
jgi:hypothetical protein